MMASLPLVAAGIVLVPGIHSWWTGRKLMERAADPAFPELLLARAQHRATISVAAGALALPVALGHWMWTIPLLIVGQLVGGFSFRRALFSESWSLGQYVRFATFSVLGAAGFWLLLGFAPRIVVAIVHGWQPAQPVIAAAILASAFAAALAAWDRRFPGVWLTLHRGSPLQRPDLEPLLDDIVRRAGVEPKPSVYRFGAPGSHMMNAVALPSVREPGVAFGDTLLAHMEPDEIAAVFAHEIAHLEHFDAKRLARLRLLTRLLIVGGVAVATAAITYASPYAALITTCWPMVVLGVLVQRTSQSQKHEAESDRRAAELMGDPEPIVRALTKLHHYSKLPRRWPYDFERSASHPSLARRIQSLRASAGVRDSVTLADAATDTTGLPPAVPSIASNAEPTVLRSTKAGSYIVLDATRIHWFDGVEPEPRTGTGAATAPASAGTLPSFAMLRERAASFRATAYTELVELRVAVSGLGRAIQVRDRAGRSSSTPLLAADVAAAQRALDMLDGQLATRGGHNWKATARLVATILALLLLASLDFGWAWIPIIAALVVPSAWALAAAGTLSAGLAAVEAFTSGGQVGPFSWVLALLVVTVGGVACVAALRWARSVDSGRRRRTVHAALAMCAALLLTGFQGYRARLALVDWTVAPTEIVAQFQPEALGRGVMLSPGGTRLSVQSVDAVQRTPYDDEDVGSWQFAIHGVGTRPDLPRRTVNAVAMAFVDDGRVLAIRPPAAGADSMELAMISIDGESSVTWRRTLPAIAAPMLSVDGASGRWTIVGHDMMSEEMVVARGALDSSAVAVERNSYELLGGRPLHAWADGSILSANVETFGGTGRVVLASLGALPYEWTLSRTSGGRREAIGPVPGVPDCTAGGGDVVHCVVVGSKGSTLWRIDGRSTLTLLGALPREFDVWRVAGSNSVVAAERGGGRLALVDAGAGRGAMLVLPDSADRQWSFMIDAATAPGLVAALTLEGGRSEVTLYRIR